MNPPTGKDAEQLIKTQIIQGISPGQALINVISPFIGRNVSVRLDKLLNNPHIPSSFAFVLKNFSIVKDLGLSNEFIRRYFIYPSGRSRPPMNFVHKTISSNLTGKSVLSSNSEDKTKPTYLFDGKNLHDLPCLTLLDGPLYIPVIRYQIAEGRGFMHYTTEYNEKIHCGTYYYYEPGSDVFLLSNKTLIAPLSELAYYYIGGDNARNKLSDVIFPPNQSWSPEQQNFINHYLNLIETSNCGVSGSYTNPPDTIPVPVKSIDQSLCMLARQMGIDAIVITYTQNLYGKHFAKYGLTEVNDTRARTVSYDSLYKTI
ncbi:Hypothetical protein HVR_LOCUS325 [uncultured virus]|nr:Hypothetical protein HVR_LOCUS325 [uncultured virus]